MIQVKRYRGNVWWVEMIDANGDCDLAWGSSNLEDALIEAEKAVRSDLDEIQARLHTERERLKAEGMR